MSGVLKFLYNPSANYSFQNVLDQKSKKNTPPLSNQLSLNKQEYEICVPKGLISFE